MNLRLRDRGLFEGEQVFFDHCKATLGQRKMWKQFHPTNGQSFFWILLEEICGPRQEPWIDWLSLVFLFADHDWLNRFIASGYFPIRSGLLVKLGRRVLGYSPNCSKIEGYDIYALPAWNESSRQDGRFLLNVLSRANVDYLMLPLLRASAGFGYGSPETLSILLLSTSVDVLNACAEDLLVCLIRDSFHEDVGQKFKTPVSLLVVSSFDPSFVRAQTQKLSCFISVAFMLGLGVEWGDCLEFCCKYGDAKRARLLLKVSGSLDVSQLIAASNFQWDQVRRISLQLLFGAPPTELPLKEHTAEVLFSVSTLSSPLHLIVFISCISFESNLFVAFSAGLYSSAVCLYVFAALLRVMESPVLWSWCIGFASLIIPVGIDFYAFSALSVIYFTCCISFCHGILMVAALCIRRKRQHRQYWLERGWNFLESGSISRLLRVRFFSSSGVFVATIVFSLSQVFDFCDLFVLSAVTIILIATCLKASFGYEAPRKHSAVLRTGFGLLLLACSVFSAVTPFFDAKNHTSKAAILLLSCGALAGAVELEKWMARKDERRGEKGVRNMTEITLRNCDE